MAVYDCAALLVVARGWRKVLERGELRARRRKHCELLMVNERRQVAFEELSKRTKLTGPGGCGGVGGAERKRGEGVWMFVWFG